MLNRPKSYSLSSHTTVGSYTHDTHHHEHSDVRTLPRNSKRSDSLLSKLTDFKKLG